MSPSASSRWTLDGRPALASASPAAGESFSISTVSVSVVCSVTWNSCFTRGCSAARHRRNSWGSALLLLVAAALGLGALRLGLALRLLALRLRLLLDEGRLLSGSGVGLGQLALGLVALLLRLCGGRARSRVVPDDVELLRHGPEVRDRPVDELFFKDRETT